MEALKPDSVGLIRLRGMNATKFEATLGPNTSRGQGGKLEVTIKPDISPDEANDILLVSLQIRMTALPAGTIDKSQFAFRVEGSVKARYSYPKEARASLDLDDWNVRCTLLQSPYQYGAELAKAYAAGLGFARVNMLWDVRDQIAPLKKMASVSQEAEAAKTAASAHSKPRPRGRKR